MVHLPPLSALRCFEAAARCSSFALAADDLRLTPSAVSHQIKSLEAFLGTQLFSRAGRKMLLTGPGATYYARIRVALEEIVGATQELALPPREEALTVGAAPSFADAWLIRHLTEFLEGNRHLRIQVLTHVNAGGPTHGSLDCEIRYGHGRWPNLQCDLLLDEQLVPLCSPALLQRRPALSRVEDLAGLMLIYTGSRRTTWDTWAHRHRLPGLNAAQHLHVDRSPLALEAAVAGLGIALESAVLASREIERGELVSPIPSAAVGDEAYYLVYPKRNAELARVQLFRAWLLGALEGAPLGRRQQALSGG